MIISSILLSIGLLMILAIVVVEVCPWGDYRPTKSPILVIPFMLFVASAVAKYIGWF